jgi:hypothetical protein
VNVTWYKATPSALIIAAPRRWSPTWSAKRREGTVDWSAPRLICIGGDFNHYDDHAAKQIQRNIELIRYRRFGADLLMLDLLVATSVKGRPCCDSRHAGRRRRHAARTI